ncbi:MAG: hypothetical protein GEV11_16550 [Streptosporangiales bacterium]|nr:hypothetical protein [Streptosporangiales bacterium]
MDALRGSRRGRTGRLRRTVIPAVAIALLAPTAACGVLGSASDAAPTGGPATPSASPTPTQRAATSQNQARVLKRLKFSPKTFACRPEVEVTVSGTWGTYGPRTAVSRGRAAKLALRNTTGRGAPVTARAFVFTPSRKMHVAYTKLNGSRWGIVGYPGSFRPRASTARRGVYTVVWVIGTGRDSAFVSCDGFVVR